MDDVKWIEKPLGELISYVARGITPKYSEGQGIVVINQKCIREFNINIEPSRLHDIEKKKVSEDKELSKYDILVNSTGVGTAGRVAQWNKDVIATVDSHVTIVRPNRTKINPLYLGYAIKSQQRIIETFAEGSTGQTELNKQRLCEEITISFPDDMKLQESIAMILKHIDDKINLNNKLNENLEELIANIFVELFDLESAEYCPISELIEVRDGTHDSPKAITEGYPLVTSKHLLKYGVNKAVANKISKKDYDKVNERSKVDNGDILLSMIGTVGLISFVMDDTIDYAIKNVGLFKTSSTQKLRYFTLSYLKNSKITNHINMCLAGSTQKYISLTELRKLPFPLFNDDQIRRFNSVVESMFLEIKSLNNENINLTILRDTLLPKLMSGEINLS